MYWYRFSRSLDLSLHSNAGFRYSENIKIIAPNTYNREDTYLTNFFENNYLGQSISFTFYGMYNAIYISFNTSPVHYFIKNVSSFTSNSYRNIGYFYVVGSNDLLDSSEYFTLMGKGIKINGSFTVLSNISYDYSATDTNKSTYMVNCNIKVNNNLYDTIVMASLSMKLEEQDSVNNNYKQSSYWNGITMYVGNLENIKDNKLKTFSSYLTQVGPGDILTFDKNDEFPPCFQFVIDNFLEKSVIPPTPDHQITTGFYQNTSTFNRIDKTNYLTKIRDVEGAFRSDLDILYPIMRYHSDTLPDFN